MKRILLYLTFLLVFTESNANPTFTCENTSPSSGTYKMQINANSYGGRASYPLWPPQVNGGLDIYTSPGSDLITPVGTSGTTVTVTSDTIATSGTCTDVAVPATNPVAFVHNFELNIGGIGTGGAARQNIQNCHLIGEFDFSFTGARCKLNTGSSILIPLYSLFNATTNKATPFEQGPTDYVYHAQTCPISVSPDKINFNGYQNKTLQTKQFTLSASSSCPNIGGYNVKLSAKYATAMTKDPANNNYCMMDSAAGSPYMGIALAPYGSTEPLDSSSAFLTCDGNARLYGSVSLNGSHPEMSGFVYIKTKSSLGNYSANAEFDIIYQ